MTSETMDPNAPSQRKRDQEIDARYGAIGIAAVAAAVRYQSASQPRAPAGRKGKDER
jgi:hypothetical protein